MSRPLRIEFEGAFYHIISRGNEKSVIFRDTKDRKNFLEIIELLVKRYHWKIHTYCLMDNHYHLLIETPLPNLSTGMRQLNGIYTQGFNLRWDRVGHLFQGRFKSYIVEKESYLLELSRYIVLNPVRAGIVRNVEDWEWSSYRILSGIKKKKDFIFTDTLWSYFSSDVIDSQKGYRGFVYSGAGQDDKLFKSAKGGFILGGEGFAKSIMQKLKTRKIDEITRKERYSDRPELEKIFHGKSRDEGIGIAINEWGYVLKEVGDFVHLHYSTVSRIAKKMSYAKNKT